MPDTVHEASAVEPGSTSRPPSQPPPRRWLPWILGTVALLIVALGTLPLVAYLRTLRQVESWADRGFEVARTLATNAPAIAARFQTGTITHTFRAGIPEVGSTRGDVLELAVSRSDETFTRSDERRIGWDWVYLGRTVVEIRVPVTFRYHLRLSDTWRLATRDQVCLVLAPPIRPSLPPAIHTDEMEKRAESGWARFDGEEQLRDLEKSMTQTLTDRAMDHAHLSLVREACRQSVAAFVRNWLLREGQWSRDRFTAIVVLFPDETTAGSDEELARDPAPQSPTILLETQ